jgi:hypothetical protein
MLYTTISDFNNKEGYKNGQTVRGNLLFYVMTEGMPNEKDIMLASDNRPIRVRVQCGQ